MKSYQQFLAEMKRRQVFRVAAIYGAVAFVIIQVADIVLPRLGLPDWTVTFMVALLILAFPVALLLAWAFEMTPEGVKRTDVAAPGEIESIMAAPASQRWPAGVAALVGVIALVASTWWIARSTAPEAPDETAVAQSADGTRFAMTGLSEDDRPSIAVLPFADMSPDGDQEYFSDGMTEEIVNVLAKISELRVAARTSAFAFKGQNPDLRAVGDSLGVEFVVEGSVRKAGDQLRITAQLIDTRDGSHLWSESYNEALTAINVFQIQIGIAEAIAGALRIPLGLDAVDLVSPTADLEAYDLYLAGRARIRERGPSLNEAVRLFKAAIARDSTWAPAWAGLAEAKELISWYTNAWGIGPVPFDEIHLGFAPLQDESEAAAKRALELNPNIASAHVAMGSVHRNRREWESGEAEYLRALSLDPDNGEAYHQYADLLGQMGRISEAVVLTERALELDRLAVRYMAYTIILAADDRLELARENARTGIGIDPSRQVFSLQRWFLEVSFLTGRFDSMFAYGSGMRSGDPTEEQQSAAIKALRTGDLGSFPRVFLEEKDWTSLWMVFGQPDSAAVEFQSKVAIRPGQNISWIWLAIFDPIREHPAYLEALRALNLEGAVPQRTPR